MLSPKKVKWRKHQRAAIEEGRGQNTLFYGDYGLQALVPGFVTNPKLKLLVLR